jgi:integrase
MKFSAADVRRLRKPGQYHDGGGLYLAVISETRRNWQLRFWINGRARVMGLGRAADVTLAEARDKAAAARKLVAAGIDPIEHRRAEQSAAQASAIKQTTFSEAAARYIAAHEAAWRHPKHSHQWRSSLATYAEPVIGALPVSDIDVNLMLRVLQPVWNRIPETASRVRSRIETVLDYATVRGWRSGPNPATWRGNLRLLLPPKTKLRQIEHFAALPWREVPRFIAELRKREGMGAKALEFAILTTTRSSEVRGARWGEVDLEAAAWTIPASRMKGNRPHRIPLSARALAILADMAKLKADGDLVFHGRQYRVPMASVALILVLRRMGYGALTAHGFRSTFRDWCADTGKPADVAEAALAHAIGSKTVAAYHRTDLFAPRRILMDEWAAFLDRAPAAVVPLLGDRASIGA